MAGKVRTGNRNIWILDPRKDLALFVLSPLWIIPFFWLAKARFDINGFGPVLLAIGGVGHHLPGFIRAYTDPVLFRRFRTRFIVAPLFLLGVCALFAALQLQSLTLVLTLWGIWHGAMQVNGFLRIYDTKAGSFSKITAWLDWAMCIAWFGGGLLYSARLMIVLNYYFRAGGPAIPPAAFTAFRHAWLIASVILTLAFLVNAGRETRQSRGPNPVKLLMMASSFAVWWFAMIEVDSLLLAVLIFEIIHDVQYNALVWVYNERRVSQQMTASRAEEFLFQPLKWKMLLYGCLVLAYGLIGVALDYVDVQVPNILQIGSGTVRFWTGLFIVSTFLHFYFDGFIWQVREKDFRKGLRIGNDGTGAVPESRRLGFIECLRVNWKWALFVFPVVVLGWSEHHGSRIPAVEQARNVAQLIPNQWQANAVAGVEEESSGDESHAIEHLQRGVALNPSFSKGDALLGDIYSRHGERRIALQYYLHAVQAYPENFDAQHRLGDLFVHEGRYADAIPHLQVAAQNPQAGEPVNYLLGAALVEERRPQEAVPYLQRAVQLNPKDKAALVFLGIAFRSGGALNEALECYRRALAIDPGYAPAENELKQVQELTASGTRR